MGKYRRLGKNAFLMFLGNIGSKSISFLMLPFYTSFLSVADYGTIDLIQVYVQLLVGICTCTLTEAIFVFPKGQEFAKQQAYFSSGLLFSVLSLIITALCFVILVLLLQRISYTGIFTEYNLCIFLMLCVTFFQSYTQQFSRSIDKVSVYVISGIVLTLTTVLTSLITLPLWGVDGYIYSIIVSYFVASVYTVIAAKEYTFISFRKISRIKLKEMLKYSIPMMPNSIMWWILSTMNRPLLEHYSGIDSVGIFAVANKFPMLISMLYTVFTYSWQISVLEEFNKPDYKQFYNKVFRVQFLVFILFVLVLTFLSRPLIKLMTTEGYYDAWKYISLLALSVVFSNMAGFVGTNFIATKESKFYFTTSLWAGIACFTLNFLLIPIYGIWGAIISLLISNILMFCLRIRKTWEYSPIMRIKLYIELLVVTVVYIISFYWIQDIHIHLCTLLIAFGVILFLNKDFLYEAYCICKSIKHKK